MAMPGLTLNTEAAASTLAQPSNRGATTATSATSSGGTTRPIQSTTPIPVPVPMPYASREQNQSHHQKSQTSNKSKEPKATTTTTTSTPRSSSPTRPPYSPITPPLKATEFPQRPTYTHSSHADATTVPVPPPEPIDFDSNPDVLALKSAISILQMQRRKAERDMATLDRVKSAALAEPNAFIQDLTTGRVRTEGGGLFGGGGGGGGGGHAARNKDEDKDSDSDMEDQSQSRTNIPAATSDEAPKQPQGAAEPKPWASIPKPQNIVRCPPINWSQYAVVGESLDKLHNEQIMRPAQGTPAVMTTDGRFEFKGGEGGGVGKQERYIGVAAPYAPGRDKIDRSSSKSKAAPKR